MESQCKVFVTVRGYGERVVRAAEALTSWGMFPSRPGFDFRRGLYRHRGNKQQVPRRHRLARGGFLFPGALGTSAGQWFRKAENYPARAGFRRV